MRGIPWKSCGDKSFLKQGGIIWNLNHNELLTLHLLVAKLFFSHLLLGSENIILKLEILLGKFPCIIIFWTGLFWEIIFSVNKNPTKYYRKFSRKVSIFQFSTCQKFSNFVIILHLVHTDIESSFLFIKLYTNLPIDKDRLCIRRQFSSWKI